MATRKSAVQKHIVGILVIATTIVAGYWSNALVNSIIPLGRRSVLLQAHCISLNGEAFAWVWPNVPFGSSQCGRKD